MIKIINKDEIPQCDPKETDRFQHLDHGIKTPDGTITPRVDRVLGCFRLLLHIASQRQVNVISTDTVRV